MTKVIFRKFVKDGQIIALFPEIIGNSRYECCSYMHIGQHCSANYALVVFNTKPAKKEEYAPLLEELKQIGYDDLKVYKRR